MTSAATQTVPLAPLRPVGPGIFQVNLLPENLRLRLAAVRRRRWWGGALLTAALLTGLGWQGAGRFAERTQRVRDTLAEEADRVRQEEKRGAVLAARAENLRRQQAVFETMRAAESWSRRLAELAAAVPERVLLTRVQLVPLENRAAPPPDAAKRPAAAQPADKFELQIEGYAADHQALAAFVRQLQRNQVYANVHLVRSAAQPLGAGEALSFALACRR